MLQNRRGIIWGVTIKPSTSPWGTSVLFVKKKDKTLRLFNSNFQTSNFQNFNFKPVFKSLKHMVNSTIPIKWNLGELICVTYKWAWVGPDISYIILINDFTSNL